MGEGSIRTILWASIVSLVSLACALVISVAFKPALPEGFAILVPLWTIMIVAALVAEIAGVVGTAQRGQYGWLVAGLLLTPLLFLLWAIVQPRGGPRELEVSSPDAPRRL